MNNLIQKAVQFGHDFNAPSLAAIGDGEAATTYTCDRCGKWIEITYSNGTRYNEVAGTFHDYRTSGGLFRRCNR